MIIIVPARGGSKGLPGKNVQMIAGKPLIVHTLETAVRVENISRVVVSTDDPEIAAVANTVSGVDVPFMRPAELATDDALAIDVYLHCVDVLSAQSRPIESICILLPTSPLRYLDDVSSCLALFDDRAARSVVSVCAAKPAAWHQILGPDSGLTDLPGIPPVLSNRQAFRYEVVVNGSIYVQDVDTLRSRRSYFGTDTYGYEMPMSRSIDIDTADDAHVAEILLKSR